MAAMLFPRDGNEVYQLRIGDIIAIIEGVVILMLAIYFIVSYSCRSCCGSSSRKRAMW